MATKTAKNPTGVMSTVKKEGGELLDNMKLKQLASKLWGFTKNNPYKALGAGALGGANLAGMLDNEYWGGQAIGGGLGAAIPLVINKLGGSISPYASAMISMTGGGLGSLFDKLRAKKAEEQAMAQQYGGGY